MSIGRLNRQRLLGSPWYATVANWGRCSMVKSIQRGTVVNGTPATITAVDVNNAILKFLGNDCSDGGTTAAVSRFRIALTNSTTVTLTGNATDNGSFEVVEFFPGVIKSVQRGTVVPGTPATITTVNTAKATVDMLGSTSSSNNNTNVIAYLQLASATSVTATANSGTNVTAGYQVVEFY